MSHVLFARAGLAMAIAAATLAPAAAADLYGQQPPPPSTGYNSYASPVANWAGAYLGVTPGYSLGSVKNNVPGVGSIRNNFNGADIGIYGGVNAVIANNIIVGGEADINISDQRQTQVNAGNVYKTSSWWNGSIRARAGMGMDRYMPFVTAGLAFSDNTLNVNGASDSKGQVGWALGAGMEGFVTDRIVVRGEFIYEGFGTQTHNVAGTSIGTNASSGILRIGAAYKF
jgi:outer membrane immunogenic protein